MIKAILVSNSRRSRRFAVFRHPRALEVGSPAGNVSGW